VPYSSHPRLFHTLFASLLASSDIGEDVIGVGALPVVLCTGDGDGERNVPVGNPWRQPVGEAAVTGSAHCDDRLLVSHHDASLHNDVNTIASIGCKPNLSVTLLADHEV
jgi:hypothetical protein